MTQSSPFLRLGTRGSALALAQAYETRRRLAAAHGVPEDDIVIEIIKVIGDQILDRALSQAGVATEGRSVSLGLATDGGAGQQAWQDRRDAGPGPRRTADITAPAAEPRRAVLSLLDLAV